MGQLCPSVASCSYTDLLLMKDMPAKERLNQVYIDPLLSRFQQILYLPRLRNQTCHYMSTDAFFAS